MLEGPNSAHRDIQSPGDGRVTEPDREGTLLMPVIEPASFRVALENISAWGDTDVFPLPMENHVLHDCVADTVQLLTKMSDAIDDSITRNPPINHSALAPVGYNGYRWATQIDPIWNACFLGAVLSLAEKIEDRRIPPSQEVIFSHRYQPDADGSLFDRSGWSKFVETSTRLAGEHDLVVSVDIADFYGRIYHHRIENELKYVDPDGGTARIIMKMMTAFSGGTSYGLPVGGPAARILSELVLNATDKLLLAQQGAIRFVRYADDYRFFVDDINTAHRTVGLLSEKLLRNEGLSLQRSKTRIMTGAEYIAANISQDPRPGTAAKFLSLHVHYDPYSPTAEDDYEQLKDQLDEFDLLGMLRSELFKGRVDIALTRKLVSTLKLMPERAREQAIISLLDNLETLAPIMPHVMRAIRDSFASTSPQTQDLVHQRLRDLISDQSHLTQVDVNLAYMLRVLSLKHSAENEQLMARLFNGPHGYAQGASPSIQRDIVLILARWNVTYWLHDAKPHYKAMHAWVQRAFLIGSYALGDEGAHWRSSVKKGLPEFDVIVQKWVANKKQKSGWSIPL